MRFEDLLSKESRAEKIAGVTYALVAILQSLALYHSDSTLGSSSLSTTIFTINIFIFLISIFFFYKTKFNNSQNSLYLLLSVAVMAALTFLNRYEGLHESRLKISFVMQVLFLSSFCFYNNKTKLVAFDFFEKFLLVSSLLGIVCFFSFLFNLGLPYSKVPFYDTDSYVYIDYKIAYFTMGPTGIRLCGLFNEPGFLGTVCALYLSAHKMVLSNWKNVVLLIAGLLSFSFAFYIIILISLLFFKAKSKNTHFIIWIVVIVFVLFPFIKEIPQVSHLLERFNLENGLLAGDNRTSIKFDAVYDSFAKSSDYLWGRGYGYKRWLGDEGVVSSYKEIIIQYGIVGSILMWASLLLAAMKSFPLKHKDIIIFVCCFMASIYQRPNIYSAMYYIILFGGINYMIYNHLLYSEK